MKRRSYRRPTTAQYNEIVMAGAGRARLILGPVTSQERRLGACEDRCQNVAAS
jgi:hypothetical protein